MKPFDLFKISRGYLLIKDITWFNFIFVLVLWANVFFTEKNILIIDWESVIKIKKFRLLEPNTTPLSPHTHLHRINIESVYQITEIRNYIMHIFQDRLYTKLSERYTYGYF